MLSYGKSVPQEIKEGAEHVAKEIADWVDSCIVLDCLQSAGAKLDQGPVPLMGRYFYNPLTDKVEAV